MGPYSGQVQEETPQQQSDVPAEEPPILVHFVNDNELKAAQERPPLLPPCKERHVEVFRVGEQYLGRSLAHRITVLLWSVPIVGPGLYADRRTQSP